MFTKTYYATREDLHHHMSGQLRIDRKDGSIKVGRRNGVAGSILVRPGLAKELEFYGATVTEHGLLVAMSDGKSTRFYVVGKNCRETLVHDIPSQCHEDAWVVFFKALLSCKTQVAVRMYNTWYTLMLEHFRENGIPVAWSIEGVWKSKEFVASFEWDPEQPEAWKVSNTFDTESRQVPVAYHPIEALYRVAKKQETYHE